MAPGPPLPSPAHRVGVVELAARLGQAHPPTPEQVLAAQAPLAPTAVVAGAGSGKTQTMGMRVVWLVANGLVEPSAVLGLTFTRKAAAELGERVRRLLRQLLWAHQRDAFLPEAVVAALGAGEPGVSTYHAYAGALVAEHGLRAGIEPSSRLVGEAVAWQYASELVSAYDGPMDAFDKALSTATAATLALAGEIAEHLCAPEQVRRHDRALERELERLPRAPRQRGGEQPATLRDLLVAARARQELLPLVERYAAEKRRRGVLDHGDSVALAAGIARDCPEVGQLERSRYAAVLLDEYQDTGEAQRVLLTCLFRGGHPVTAVGDPHQSIYGWRGASAGNLERFPRDFPRRDGAPADSLGLSCSFRNGERILAAANRIAAALPVTGLVDRPLTPGPGRAGAGAVVPALHVSVEDEARWVAERIRARRSEAPGTSIAVLARRRAAFPLLEGELRARGVPCEVVGLGGLLLQPEVVDVVATLRVLADPLAGSAVVRLLTGPRWRLGPRDLDALGRRARALATGRTGEQAGSSADVGPGFVDQAPDVADDGSLVDALDDPGRPEAYSPAGYRRLGALREELRELRRWSAQPLPDLVASVIRVLRLDVELAARPAVRPGDALVHLDRLLEVAEEFSAAGEDPGLPAFLAYLDAAEERERGLETDAVEPDPERVQLLTVHAAKGLEWDAVFVVGLTEKVFPVEGQAVPDWTRHEATLPFPLRGDRSDLPELELGRAGDQKAAATAVEDFSQRCRDRSRREERRLAYVAVTRARDLLACSGSWWDTQQKPQGPSEFLREIEQACRESGQVPEVWAPPPEDGAPNPLLARDRSAPWPVDPLGERRAQLEEAAALVTAAGDAPAEAERLPAPLAGQAQQWAREVELLLAEQQRSSSGGGVVELPAALSVSGLVTLRRDPAELAQQIRRPVPVQPRPLARRGTRFHLWLEQHWGQQRLLDLHELPGAADETAEPDADLLALQEAFRASPWWRRTPAEVEFPFDMVVEGLLLRGRVDAVFTDSPDGLVDVVDWKTGTPPAGAAAEAAAVQLAVYRLAWHALTDTPLSRIRAAFHYVATGRTVRPVDLLDGAALVELVRSVPVGEQPDQRRSSTTSPQ